jgi:hypothetical protein
MTEERAAPSLRDEILGEKTDFDTFTLFVPAPDLPGHQTKDDGEIELLPPPTEDDLRAFKALLEGQAADVEAKAKANKEATAEMLDVAMQHARELRERAAEFEPSKFTKRTFKFRRPVLKDRTTVQRLAGVKMKAGQTKKQIEEQEIDNERFVAAVAIVTLCDENGQALFVKENLEQLLDVPVEGLGGRAMAEAARRYNVAAGAGKAFARRRTSGSSSNSRGS